MRVTPILLAAWVTQVLAQKHNTVDKCHTACFRNVIDSPPSDLGCAAGDMKCFCKEGSNFQNAVRDCAQAACAEQAAGIVINTAGRLMNQAVCLDNIINNPPPIGCTGGDQACLCKNANFLHAVRDCAAAACTHEAVPKIVKKAEDMCAALGTESKQEPQEDEDEECEAPELSTTAASTPSGSSTASGFSRTLTPSMTQSKPVASTPITLSTTTKPPIASHTVVASSRPVTGGSTKPSPAPLAQPSTIRAVVNSAGSLYNVTSVTSKVTPSGEMTPAGQKAIEDAMKTISETQSANEAVIEGMTAAAEGQTAANLPKEVVDQIVIFVLAPNCPVSNKVKIEIIYWLCFGATSEKRSRILASVDTHIFTEINIILQQGSMLPVTLRTALHAFVSKNDQAIQSHTVAASLSVFVTEVAPKLVSEQTITAIVGWLTCANAKPEEIPGSFGSLIGSGIPGSSGRPEGSGSSTYPRGSTNSEHSQGSEGSESSGSQQEPQGFNGNGNVDGSATPSATATVTVMATVTATETACTSTCVCPPN
ncbi:hypothetical protein EYZ11_009214 [Aspergillus tanneri]|uniref:CFEM domain-containing protein n=1 Tax=Aspergillus tanneri TaxID=1220188 RepID=A0A4S3JAM0_9EURO|nr:hypothetical protein EYZ11_009214 [Aspergillus tanneri]